MSRQPRRRGFTLIELLVAIAIIGVLMALLAPAVQSARSSAQRVTCRNQLRQLGLALHTYHDGSGCFPPGSFVMGPSYPIQSGWGWGAMILPSLEQAALHQRIDFGKGTAVGPNLALIGTPISFWRCPSDVNVELIEVSPVTHPKFNLASGNYCGSDPVLSFMSNARLRDIYDGASQTVILGERRVQESVNGSLPFTSSWCGNVAFEDGYEYRSIPHLEMNRQHPVNASASDYLCFSSNHAGGAYFVMGDNSVRFFNENMDLAVYEALGTPDGGETVAVPP